MNYYFVLYDDRPLQTFWDGMQALNVLSSHIDAQISSAKMKIEQKALPIDILPL